ncbi:MAG: condensation domain-containing protein, partial [Anaerolineales bacterium]
MPLRRAKGEAPILSFAQERVWFLQHLEPTNPAYNRPLVMRLRGPLVFEALQSALLTIQQRHETLRAVFDIEAGKPTLRISDQALAKLELHDLCNLSGQAQRTALIQELQDRAHQVFSLRGEPIFRANLFRLADDDHVLSLVFHHLAFDRWSEEVFRNELGLLYQAHLHNQPSPLPQLEAHYADFAYWQRKWIESEAGQQQHQYWMSRLEGDLPGLELPIDARRPAQRSHTAATVFFDLSADLSRLVRGLSRRGNVTTHTTLMTALLVLLHRYSFQEDILIGIPTAGRMLPETEPMIGLFINTLAARHDLSGDPTVQELLQRVSRTTLADLSHQDYPFELVVQALNPTRDLRTTPLFQVLFNYENVPTRASSFESLQVEPFDYDPGLAQFDLTLEIEDRADHLACGLSFNQDIFQRSTIERIAGHYRTLLEGFVSDSQAHIADLPLLTQEEIPTLDMNRTDPAVPAVENLSAWFENQVDQTPTAVAVEFEGEMLTYAALNEQANRLAHLLIKQGVGPNHLVGLCFQPSLNMVVGIVAILKAGGAYVPLDPDFPDERLRFQLGDAAIDLVVSEGSHLSSIMTQSVSILAVDAQAEQIAAMSDENPQVNVGLGDLAYVLYTSGSTGEPKGVMITHGNVIHLLQVTQERCRFGPDDVWALFHSFTFDFSVWELFGALLHGGRLIVIPVSMRRSLDDFFTRVVFERLTVMSMIPPLFFEAARLPQFYDRLRGSKVRQIFLGGDELEAARLEPFFQGSGNAKIHITNIYGPTEATVFCTWHELSRLDLQETLGSVIGRPLDGVSSLVLDPNMNLLPAGA